MPGRHTQEAEARYVAAATVALNYAVLAGLQPKASITLEDEQSKWHLVWAARKDRKDDPRFIPTW